MGERERTLRVFRSRRGTLVKIEDVILSLVDLKEGVDPSPARFTGDSVREYIQSTIDAWRDLRDQAE